MEKIGQLIFGLMPLCIGLFAIELLSGKLVIREKDGTQRQIVGTFRMNLWFMAVLSTSGGLLVLAAACGLLPAQPN